MNGAPPPVAGFTLMLPAALLLAAFAGAVNLDGRFVYDDLPAIQENPLVRGDLSLLATFTHSFWGEPLGSDITTYRPLTPLLWRLLWWGGGGDPVPFRVVSLLLHVLAISLLWAAGRALGVEPRRLGLAAGLAAVLPAQAEAVGATVGQADLLSACFGLAAVWSAAQAGRPRRAAGAAALLFLSCLAKESGCLFAPPVFLLILTAPDVRGARRATAVIPAVAVLAGVVLFQLSLGRSTEHWNSSLVFDTHGPTRLLLGLHLAGRAAAMLVFSWGLAPAHGYASLDPTWHTLGPHALPGTLVLVVGSVAMRRALRKGERVTAALWLLLLGDLALLSSLVVRLPTDLPERLLYPGTLAIAGLAAGLLGAARHRHRALVPVLLAACVLGRVHAQRPWHDEAALWEHAVAVEPKVIRNQYNLAQVRWRQGRIDEAAWHRLLAAWLNDRYPRRVDWSVPRRLERESKGWDRLARAPGALNPDDPCRMVGGMLEVYRRTLPEVEQVTRDLWRREYPACPGSGPP